jgi:hypothetical protein
MSQPDQRFVTVTISIRPGFGLAVKLCCWAAMLLAVASPRLAGRFVDGALRLLPRLFCRVAT